MRAKITVNRNKPTLVADGLSLGWLIALVMALIIVASFLGSLPRSAVADAVSDTSLSLSSSEKAAEDVEYKLRFTAESNGTDSVVVDVCSESVLLSDNCSQPVGFNIDEVDTPGSDTVTQLGPHTVMVELSVVADQGDTVEVVLSGVKNPSSAGALYLRFATYLSAELAGQYVSGNPGSSLDYGGVIATINDEVGMMGDVPEVLEFCTSGQSFDRDGCKGELLPPKLKLGDKGLLSDSVSTATVYTRLSTNALHGAVVSLRSNTEDCGGLIRLGAAGDCDIKPQTTAGELTAGSARFGLKLGTIDRSSGLVALGGYSSSEYYLNYQPGDEAGVTSPLGDVIYGSDEPVPGGVVPLVFGASKAPSTPAGDYFADINLIATGTF